MNMFLDYFKEVRQCNCETFQERRGHLWPTFMISTIFFSVYYLFIRGPHYGFTSAVFKHEVIGGVFPLVSFFISAYLSRKFTINQILAIPTMVCFASAAYHLTTPEYFLAEPSLFTHMIIIGIFYGSFISSIRCNLILNIFGAILPYMIALNVEHVETTYVIQVMAPIIFAGLLGAAFSYRMNVYQKGMNRLESKLREEKRALENAQTVAKLGNWSFDVKTGEVKWSKLLSLRP
jgi:hypothetical protein